MIVAAVDLGTTRVKGGLFGPDGISGAIVSRAAPPLAGTGLVRESSADAYRRTATEVLEEVLARAPAGTRLGLASQRSSFVLWNRESGEPVTPLISWQDRRAAEWCEEHRGLEPEIERRTGLRLSPHYAGPKLAALLASEPHLSAGLCDGTLLFGTLDSYLIWHWSGGARHEIDATMAARTLLADARDGRWSERLLAAFGLPRAALPAIVPSSGRATPIRGGASIAASVADQAAAVLAILGGGTAGAVIILGTGGFVLRPSGPSLSPRPGYLAGPILGRGARSLFAIEGTINGAAAAADRYGPGPCELPREDPSPEALCLPDVAGLGAPHWLPGRTLTLAPAAEALSPQEKRRIVLEGIVFRCREILEGLGGASDPGDVHLAGGLARDPFVAPALAACLGRPVQLVEEAEATLAGAGWLACGVEGGRPALSRHAVPPGPAGSYLAAKYGRWRIWLARTLAGSPE